MYFSGDLLIFQELNRSKFFDVLQVFVLFHTIGASKLVFMHCFFACYIGYWAYLSL